jgi:hypothetical protein
LQGENRTEYGLEKRVDLSEIASGETKRRSLRPARPSLCNCFHSLIDLLQEKGVLQREEIEEMLKRAR